MSVFRKMPLLMQILSKQLNPFCAKRMASGETGTGSTMSTIHFVLSCIKMGSLLSNSRAASTAAHSSKSMI